MRFIFAFWNNFSEMCTFIGLVVSFILLTITLMKEKWFVKRISFFCQRTLHHRRNRKRKDFYATSLDNDYIDFQNKTMRLLYKEKIEELNNAGIEITNTEWLETQFESVNIPSQYVTYSFQGLISKKSGLEYFDLKSSTSKKDCRKYSPSKRDKKFFGSTREYRMAKSYYKIVSPNIHYPFNGAYILDEMAFDCGKMMIKAKVGFYYQNILTSNALEYELYNLYFRESKKIKELEPELFAYTKENVQWFLKRLPMRARILKANKKLSKK